jgi:hypothetical protein
MITGRVDPEEHVERPQQRRPCQANDKYARPALMDNMDKKPSPNDQRSNVKNPNNPASKEAADNRSNQVNPEHKASKSKK